MEYLPNGEKTFDMLVELVGPKIQKKKDIKLDIQCVQENVYLLVITLRYNTCNL